MKTLERPIDEAVITIAAREPAGEQPRNDIFLLRLRALALAGTIVAALALALLRVYVEPIFGPSDEDDHFDYAISIARAGHLLNARNALGFPEADLETDFLQTYADRPRIYLNPGERVPQTYGTHRYFERIDLRSSAELPDQSVALNRPGHVNPVLISMYPFGFYALDALAIDASWLMQHSLSSAFFAARLMSVALLTLTLLFAFGLAREMRLSRIASLGVVAIAGCLTLTTFVASYVQPDNLAALCVTAIAYYTLRLRRVTTPLSWRGLAVAFAVLWITKYQTALCVTLAGVPAVTTICYAQSRNLARTARRIALLAVPSIAALAIQTIVVGKNTAFAESLGTHFVVFTDPTHLPSDLLAFVRGLVEGAWYFFIGDVQPPLTHDYRYAAAISYWNMYGNLDTRVTLLSPAVDRVARALIAALTALMAVAAGALALRLSRRLWTVARCGHRLAALRIATADAGTNGYVVFCAFMILFYALTANHWRTSGRNFFPFVVPAMLFALAVAPRALPRGIARRAAAGVMFALLGAYAIAGSYASAAAVRERYYGAPALAALETHTTNGKGALLVNSFSSGDPFGAMPFEAAGNGRLAAPRIKHGDEFDIEGLAADLRAQGAAGGVIAVVDGRRQIAAGYGYSHEDLADRFGDDALFWAGYRVMIPTANLPLGPHRIRLWVVSQDRRSVSEAPVAVNVVVVPRDGVAATSDRTPALAPQPSKLPQSIRAIGTIGAVDQISMLDDATYWSPGPLWLRRDGPLFIKGWAIDATRRRPLAKIRIAIDGIVRADARTGLVRPDIVLAFPALPLAATGGAGWNAILPPGALEPGEHVARVETLDARGRAVTLAAVNIVLL